MPGRQIVMNTGFNAEPVPAAAAREEAVLEALSLLTPYDLEGERKARFGAPGTGDYALGDGTYVLVDRCRPSQAILSYGVGSTVNFEMAMAEAGHPVFLFDHTVAALPEQHERFTWFQEGVCGTPGPDRALATLEQHLARIDVGADAPILKLDVEGAEWDVFACAPTAVLRRFEQITFEAHNLDQLADPAFNALARQALGALAAEFTLCHVHANNYGFIHLVAGSLPVAETLELTYIRSDLVRALPSTTIYPTEIDLPNYRTLTELRLWFYPFLPGVRAFDPRLRDP
jgi:hypothetical protein